MNKKLILHPYFQYFDLPSEYFDPIGNKCYSNTSKIETRGGWPYFKPVNCKRYGLNDITKYSPLFTKLKKFLLEVNAK